MNGLRDRVFVIAGGATGIGAAAAERLAAEGATVVVGDVDGGGATAVAERITGTGARARAVQFDLSDTASIEELHTVALREFGALHGVFNVGADLSPGTLGRDSDLPDMDDAVWERTLRVNLLGFAHSCRIAVPMLLEAGGGAVVNTSSGAAFSGEAVRPAYAASKAGVNALTRHVASRWGKEGIRCNAVSPGAVMSETALTTMGEEFRARLLAGNRSTRLGRPSDLAAAAAFLLSDDAEWVNGQVWTVDGGGLLRD